MIPIIISLASVVLAFASFILAYRSWKSNTEPAIAFTWDNKHECYCMINVGKGPAMNIIVAYINDRESPEWKNPVRCYSIAPNEKIHIDWGLKSEGILYSKEKDKDKKSEPDSFLNGVTKIGAVYSSISFSCEKKYTSICEHDITKIKIGNKLKKWREGELSRIWDLKRRTEEK